MGFLDRIIGSTTVLLAALSASEQNGKSLLGTMQAPKFPSFLTNNPLPGGFPWGLKSAAGNNPYTDCPTTGATRSYDFTVTRGFIAPDGFNKSVILINGQFPGPTIEANWGDQIVVTVHNKILSPPEGVAFHWHGLLQKGTPWEDGVPAIDQCPITPGTDFTYSFKADLYGTSWYHSHYSAQYSDGLLGPMIIHGPKNAKYDIDLGPVFLTDYYHRAYFDILKDTLTTDGDFEKIAPSSDNNLINGKMDFDCTLANNATACTPNAGLSKFKFTKGKIHRLRLINGGSEGLQRFSIDGHQMTIIANDFVPVQPYTTNVVTLGVGQRTDVLVTGIGSLTDSFWMRSNISTICSLSKQPNALAVIYYDQADINSVPKSEAWNVPDPGTCDNDALTSTVPMFQMAATPLSETFIQPYDISFAPNATNHFLWSVNNQTFRGNYNSPVLLQANAGDLSFPKESNVYNFGTNKSITFVVNNPAGLPSHPMHMHGHNFLVLHSGPGRWDGVTITNPSNPQRRDVQQLPGGSHIVIQIPADNPGAWPLHCHITWHVSNGLYITVLERPDQIKAFSIPPQFGQSCKNWAEFSKSVVIDQIDSGLRRRKRVTF